MAITPVINEGIGPASAIKHVIRQGLQATIYASAGHHIVSEGLGAGIADVIRHGLSGTPASQSATTCTTTSWTGYSLQENQTPPVAVGDTFLADLVSTPGGYSITVAGDGTVTMDSHGDTTRQYFHADIYDASLAALYGAFLVYINNHAPQINNQPPDIQSLTNNAITSLNWTAGGYIIDQDADPLTSAQTSGSLPVGLVHDGTLNVTSGTPTSVVNNPVTWRFTDIAGDYVDATINILTDVGAIVPNVVGLTQTEATAQLTALLFEYDPLSTSDYSNTVPAGNVISQSVPADSRVFTGTSVAVVISLGVLITTVTVPSGVGLTQAAAEAVIIAGSLVSAVALINSSIVAGTVVSQLPTAGSNATPGDTITLFVSLGPLIVITSTASVATAQFSHDTARATFRSEN